MGEIVLERDSSSFAEAAIWERWTSCGSTESLFFILDKLYFPFHLILFLLSLSTRRLRCPVLLEAITVLHLPVFLGLVHHG